MGIGCVEDASTTVCDLLNERIRRVGFIVDNTIAVYQVWKLSFEIDISLDFLSEAVCRGADVPSFKLFQWTKQLFCGNDRWCLL
jgi:hypothetical protein